jgi:hypothetical protein
MKTFPRRARHPVTGEIKRAAGGSGDPQTDIQAASSHTRGRKSRGISMEAIRKIQPKTVMETLDEFKRRYPRDKFIWVNAPLETAGPWPEHYGLGARVFKVPTDHIVKYTSPKTQKVSQQNGWIYELNGMWALSKPSKLQIMHDAGVIFSRERLQRIDDGSDPDICEMEGAAAILSISGLLTVSGRKRIDLKISFGVKREFLIENCESKLEIRLGWKLVGLPQAFTMEELKAKEFVTFCIFSAPHAVNPEERMLILRHHLGIWGPAFGDARPIELGVVDAPRQIEAPRDEEPEDIEVTIEDPEPATQQQNAGGNAPEAIVQPRQVHDATEAPPAPVNQSSPDGGGNGAALPRSPLDPPDPSGSSKITAEKITFPQAVQKFKADLFALLGDAEGATAYYKLLLEVAGVAHSNELTAGEKQKTFYRKLEALVKSTRDNPAPVPAKPFAEALAMARGGYEKLAVEKLVERIEAQMELQHYPDAEDPLGIIPVITQGNKADLVNAAVKLMERGLIQTRDERDEARGGTR